jgi:FAD:protein FMN transferase
VRVTPERAADFAAPGQTIALRTGGLATSSTASRRWSGKHGELHHILDPRTGRPAPEHWRAVSVAAGSCLDANVASTAAILQAAPAAGWLAERALPARLTRADGRVVLVAGWPPETGA